MDKKSETVIEEGSGNVFADIGMTDAEEHLAKAKLVLVLAQTIQAQNLTQAEAAERMGVDQPSVSRLLKGNFRGFSSDRLFTFLNRLGQDVTISVVPARNSSGHTLVAVIP